MKTWDMLEILAKYPEKKFNNKLLGQVELHEGILVWSSNMEDVVISDTLLKMEWEEVKEPVTFMELIEAVRIKPGTTFKYSNRELNYHFTGDLTQFLFDIADVFLNVTIAEMISEGEFYI